MLSKHNIFILQVIQLWEYARLECLEYSRPAGVYIHPRFYSSRRCMLYYSSTATLFPRRRHPGTRKANAPQPHHISLRPEAEPPFLTITFTHSSSHHKLHSSPEPPPIPHQHLCPFLTSIVSPQPRNPLFSHPFPTSITPQPLVPYQHLHPSIPHSRHVTITPQLPSFITHSHLNSSTHRLLCSLVFHASWRCHVWL